MLGAGFVEGCAGNYEEEDWGWCWMVAIGSFNEGSSFYGGSFNGGSFYGGSFNGFNDSSRNNFDTGMISSYSDSLIASFIDSFINNFIGNLCMKSRFRGDERWEYKCVRCQDCYYKEDIAGGGELTGGGPWRLASCRERSALTGAVVSPRAKPILYFHAVYFHAGDKRI